MPENLKCDHCGSPISDNKSAVERDGKSYCSDGCANQGQEQRSPSKPRTPSV